RPSVFVDRGARRLLLQCVSRLVDLSANRASAQAIAHLRESTNQLAARLPAPVRLETALCASVFCDLRAQGRQFRQSGKEIEVTPPTDEGSAEDRKAQIRAAHLIERDAQLRQPSVRRFVREMEGRRLHNGEWHSIFSLMRDGRELGEALRQAAALPPG